MSKEIQKKGILPNSSVPVAKGARDDKGRKIKPLAPKVYDGEKQIKEMGLKAVENFTYIDPITGDQKSFVIDRRGTTDQKAGLALLDPKLSREQKDSVISMYLFEQGKQGASMLMDLWQYKGQHTKESRAFNSTMRYDFELFLHTFQMFMQDSADLILKELNLEIGEIKDEHGKKITVVHGTEKVTTNDIARVLGEYANYFKMTSTLLEKRIRAEVEKRERAKGKGIYIGIDNKPYSVYEDDDIVKVVEKDKAEADEEKHASDTK